MKSLQAFAAGVLVGVLVTLGASRFLSPGPASRDFSRVITFLENTGAGFAARIETLLTPRPPAFRRQVTQRLRMARTGVVLTHHILVDEVPSSGTASAMQVVPAATAAPSDSPAPAPSSASAAAPAVSTPRAAPAENAVENGAHGTAAEAAVGRPARAGADPAPEHAEPDPGRRYARALEAYRDGRHEDSRRILASFLRDFSGHALVPNALYWTGETWYARARYDRAMEFFARVLAEHPRHAKSPDALLKLAYSALRLGRADLARAYLDQLLARYPDSGASRLGRQARGRLEGESGEGAVVVSRG
jgi:tol-pal system protein YbgF